MGVEELKATLDEQFKAFKEAMPKFVDEAGLTKAFNDFKAEMQKEYANQVQKSDFDTLEKAMKEHGRILAEMQKNGTPGTTKDDFKRELAQKLEAFDVQNKDSKATVFTTTKAVTSSNFTSDTMAYRENGVGEIKRGVPYIRDLFQVVNVGTNSHDTVSWYEQLAVTNNATNVAEVRVAGSQSNITWVQKNLNSRRIYDYIKVGRDRIKDVNFVMGEVERLINRNMRLKENDQLINGVGTGNEIAGILSYATEFDTTGIEIQDANLIDLLGKIKTQIDTDMLGAASPNRWIANRVDVDEVRYKKDTTNRYMFESWALGAPVNVGDMVGIENPLVTENTLIAGDFTLGTLYVWDDLVIEMFYEGTDQREGYVTIGAYMRENLRVQDVDKKGFVKVSDIAATLDAINVSIQQG